MTTKVKPTVSKDSLFSKEILDRQHEFGLWATGKTPPTEIVSERIEEKIYQHPAGHWICEVIDNEYPYGSALGMGKDDVEAKMNAWYLRKKILEKQLSTSPTMAIPVETYKEAMERIKL